MKRLKRRMRLGKYRLDRRMGEGASAEVWLARDTVEQRPVAIKVVPPAVIAEFGRHEIEHEARVASRLEHPNVLRVRNADWIDGYFVLATDPAERSLEDSAAARRSPALALQLIRDVAAGLAFAHERGILHRDIKPGNILVFPGRHAKLGDFGTARLAAPKTRIYTDVGTFGYMAPEQAYGRPGFASDVFSLGLVAYELLAGVLPGWPFERPLRGEARFMARTPAPVQPVLLRAIEVRISKRWPDAPAFHEALEAAMRRAEKPARKKPRRRTPRETPTPFELEARWCLRQHGKALALRYDCHQCGGPIAEAMKLCPWCGSDRNSFVEVSEYPMVCPECERGARPEWNYCPWCHRGRFESNGRKPPPDARAERSCRKRGCEGQLRPFMRYCPMCHTRVQRPWRRPGLSPCHRCQQPTAERWRHCGWCGVRRSRALDL